MSHGSQIRIVTYNIWGWNTPCHYWTRRGIVRGALPSSPALEVDDPAEVWRRRRALLAAEIARADPDLVAFQESFRPPGGTESQAAQLAAALTGAPGTSDGTYHVVDGPGGLAVIGRFRPLRVREHALDVESYGGYQGVFEVTVSAPSGEVTVVVVHWPVGPDEAKVRCAVQTLGICQGLSAERLILCGDFNADSGSAPIRRLTAAGWLADAWRAPGQALSAPKTQPLPRPSMRLDYVFSGPRHALISEASCVLGGNADNSGFFPSDHCGFSAVLSLLNSAPVSAACVGLDDCLASKS